MEKSSEVENAWVKSFRESDKRNPDFASKDIKLKRYAEKYIKALRCNRFVQKKDEAKSVNLSSTNKEVPKKDDENSTKKEVPEKDEEIFLNMCCCGREKSDHKDHKDTHDRKWDPEQITTNAYGEMKLSGFPGFAGTKIKYVRASKTETLCANLYHIMTEIWNFKKPDLIISINGGAQKMIPPTNEQKCAFRRGLINLSRTSSIWIITGGFNFGVSELVGEAAKENKIESQHNSLTVLGIGHWGAVYNRKDLVVNDGEVTYHNAEDQLDENGSAPLDPNHDAFILYDSGTEGGFEKEIDFRAEFEMFLSKEAMCGVVQVIVEGGKILIIKVKEALDNDIPVVVMKGSMGAADLICDTIESDENSIPDVINDGPQKNEKDSKEKPQKSDIINEALQKYKLEWSISTDAEMDSLRVHLQSFNDFKQKNLIHIFSMSDLNKTLDMAILEAAFSGKIIGQDMDVQERLTIAMKFNCHDQAKKCLTIENPWMHYQNLIGIALERGQWEFVKLFLARGARVRSFLTKEMLKDLYSEKIMKEHLESNVFGIIKKLIDNASLTKKGRIETIGLVVSRLTQGLITNLYTGNKKTTDRKEENENDMVSDSSTISIDSEGRRKNGFGCCPSLNVSEKFDLTIYPKKNKKNERLYTEQDLFIWALLTQRWEMAKIFWKMGKDHIGSALIASFICKSLSKTALSQGELDMNKTLHNQWIEYENRAIEVLKEAYGSDKTRTHFLLIRALPYWDRVTCMEIANRAKLYHFLANDACQTRLNHIWRGGMSNVSVPLLLMNMPLVFIISKWYIFCHDICSKKKFENNKPEDDTPTEGEYLKIFRRKQDITSQNVSYCKSVPLYYRSPIIKFTMHIISYLLFLTIFSYTLLVELLPIRNVTTTSQRQMEYAVYAYIVSFVFEELRQAFVGNQIDSLAERLKDWLCSPWNIYDLILYNTFFIAFILRHISFIDFVYARTLFSVTLSMFFIRFLQFYYANRYLGPKVIFVSRMIKDIVFFLALYVVAIFAYGTFAQALLFSNSPINRFLLKNIVYMPYWQSYGDLNIEYVEGNNVNATPNAFVIVAFACFMLFTNALFMNMLVAMFGITFQKVEENSNRIWALNRYHLIEEFYYRPIMPPPLNVFEIMWKLCRALQLKSWEEKHHKRNDFIVNLCHQEDIQSSGFERLCHEKILLDKLRRGESDKSLSNV